MPAQVITDLTNEVAQSVSVENSATILINGISTRIKDAVAKAIENGATAEELAPLTDVAKQLDESNKALADAITANTPAEG